ncbi:CheR family methyltransferase [Thalassoroseus pseudoceratinae]|uniref:CheR family methyltransferase n=1 Tax=Thalassoroseus pseudoceratinae TaxID=2713176 RepID=UPI001F0D4DBF|nr:protein-glutamate O-methyltransferase CheR [Thalassoroseus pseudoceratinae]
MTTNESLFFRDKKPFDDLKDTLIPEIIQDRATHRHIRIWCAACSTGQEPYSLLMMLAENFAQLDSWRVEVVATDLDSKALERAKNGLYSQMEVQRGLPIQLLLKYFRQVDTSWQVIDELRHQVTWKQWNLLDSFAGLGQFDLILCRNVLIYFDESLKREIFQKLTKSLRDNGPLILGAAETVIGLSKDFARDTRCRSSVYRFRNQPSAL